MALTPSNARFPLVRYLAFEKGVVDDLQRLMREAAREAEAGMKALVGKNPVTVAQAAVMQGNARSIIGTTFRNIDELLTRGTELAFQAGYLTMLQYEGGLLKELIGAEAFETYARSEAERAANGVRRFLDRESSSKLPLSKQVYKTSQLAAGQVDREISKSLIFGESARDLAKRVVGMINPLVPGGPSYSAMRLGRTELNNAFHAGAVRRAQDSGLVDEMNWHLSSSHPRPDICNEYEANSPYDVNNVPSKPHPQCFCFVTPSLPSREEFKRKLLEGDYDGEAWADSRNPPGANPLTNLVGTSQPGRAWSNAEYASNYKQWASHLDPADQNKLQSYTSGGTAVNSTLRKGLAGADRGVAEMVSDVEEIFRKHGRVMTEPTTLHRGVFNSNAFDPEKVFSEALRTGKEFVEPGYMSTSSSGDFIASTFSNAWRYEINAPPGSQYIFGAESQFEVVLARNSRFIVDSIDYENHVIRMVLQT